MKILVANLGSTSFKYRLFDMTTERQLARGGTERIGSPESKCFVEIGGKRHEQTAQVPDHAVAVRMCLEQLTDPSEGCLKEAKEVAAIGFKGGLAMESFINMPPELAYGLAVWRPVAENMEEVMGNGLPFLRNKAKQYGLI